MRGGINKCLPSHTGEGKVEMDDFLSYSERKKHYHFGVSREDNRPLLGCLLLKTAPRALRLCLSGLYLGLVAFLCGKATIVQRPRKKNRGLPGH